MAQLSYHKLTQLFSNIVKVIPNVNIYNRIQMLSDINKYAIQSEIRITELEKRIELLEKIHLENSNKNSNENNNKNGKNKKIECGSECCGECGNCSKH